MCRTLWTPCIYTTAELSERNFRNGFEMKLTSPLCGTQQTGVLETAAKSVTSFLLAVNDCKRLDASLYFIITNLHTELKPQMQVGHDMNSITLTLHVTLDYPWTIGKSHFCDQV